jgi:chitosanase
MRDRTDEQFGKAVTAGEHSWIAAYVKIRRAWLWGHSRSDLRATVYRMDTFRSLIGQGLWNLELPLVVRGKEISIASLAALPPGCYDGPKVGTRALSLQSPLQRGLDVRHVQLGLSASGMDIKADGIFGQHSSYCIKNYQVANNLPVTGAADLSLISQLAALDKNN